MVCLGNERRLFCRFWDCIQVLHFGLLLTTMATPFLLRSLYFAYFWMHTLFYCNNAAAAAKSLQSCPTLCDPIDSSPPGSHPWDSPGKNTGVGCHFLLQCMKMKSESEIAQSCPTLRNPMDCSQPGSPVHGIFQARVLEWGAIAVSENTSHVMLNVVAVSVVWGQWLEG